MTINTSCTLKSSEPRWMCSMALAVLAAILTTPSCTEDSENSGIIPNTEINQVDAGDKDWRLYFMTVGDYSVYVLSTNTPSPFRSTSLFGEFQYSAASEYWVAEQAPNSKDQASAFQDLGGSVSNHDPLILTGYTDGCWETDNDGNFTDPFKDVLLQGTIYNMYETVEYPRWNAISYDEVKGGSYYFASENSCTNYGGFSLNIANNASCNDTIYKNTWVASLESLDSPWAIDGCAFKKFEWDESAEPACEDSNWYIKTNNWWLKGSASGTKRTLIEANTDCGGGSGSGSGGCGG